MTILASIANDEETSPQPIGSRGELACFMVRMCARIGADSYMLVEPSVEHGSKSVRILTSNWIFDAIEDLASSGIASIIESGCTIDAGATPKALPCSASSLSAEARRALCEHGHAEIYCLKLTAAGGTMFALFSANEPQRMARRALVSAHMACRYAIAQFYRASGNRASRDPLSERERECLLWVSEGKTSDEVALILGVSSNTVGSYVANAIQKFGANNRAMAIATAIRSGII